VNAATYRNHLRREGLPDDPLAKRGLIISVKKSQVSKWHNIPQMSFIKFLGLTYNLMTNQIHSSTRSGRKLLFNFYNLIDESRYYETLRSFKRSDLWHRLLTQLDIPTLSTILSSRLLKYTLKHGMSKKLLVHYLTRGLAKNTDYEGTEYVILKNTLRLYLEYRFKQRIQPVITSYKA